MTNTFYLMLLFKPLTTRLVISASSLLSSKLTRDVILENTCFTDGDSPHVCILRKEGSWKDYFQERQKNTYQLKKFDRYKNFFNENIIESINELPTLRKLNNYGVDTSRAWVERAEKIVKINNFNKNIKN